MRDRRNTSLSVSSNSSSASTVSAPSRTSLNEKRLPSSPPLSPTLPPPVTRSNAPRTLGRRAGVVRGVILLSSLLLLWRCFSGWSRLESKLQPQVDLDDGLEGGDDLPDEPTALVIPDDHGHHKWTVAVPHNASFPLPSSVYTALCRQGEDLSYGLQSEARSFNLMDSHRKTSYYTVDRHFLDVQDAEQSGALPLPQMPLMEDACRTSLTFALETDDASFGKTLLMLWLSYGVAKKEGRAFFIDDTRWPYGRYTSYFAPPPSQGCSPPPVHHILPCPHQARHLLVSAATAPWTFGPAFRNEFTRRRTNGVEKHRRIYDLLRLGYQDLFQLVDEDAAYARSRTDKLEEEAASRGGSVVGMHIRRGDLHPSEYQFTRDYLPLERYAARARSLFRSLLSGSSPPAGSHRSDLDDFTAVVEYTRSPLLLASDDPDVFASSELSQAAAPFAIQRAQERIMLATKATLDRTSPVAPIREPGSAYVKHVDENAGWEGGFYSALFYSLGTSRANPSPGGHEPSTGSSTTDAAGTGVAEDAMRMRELVARAYLLDLAVLGGSDGVVCAVSSAACRILGVMLGWEAVMAGRWVNVDDGRVWSWDGRR